MAVFDFTLINEFLNNLNGLNKKKIGTALKL